MTTALKHLSENIAQTFRSNLIPAVFLQILALLLALSYYYWPLTKPAFMFFAELKQSTGAAYATASTAIFGGAIPFLYLFLSGRIHSKPLAQFIFYCLVWALIGAMVDALYEFQSVLFGSTANLSTVIKKTLFDQVLFSALLTCPLLTVLYLWKDYDFSLSTTRQNIDKSLFLEKIPATIATNWIIWFPSVALIYSLPQALQIPMYNIVLCFFVLVLSMLKRK